MQGNEKIFLGWKNYFFLFKNSKNHFIASAAIIIPAQEKKCSFLG